MKCPQIAHWMRIRLCKFFFLQESAPLSFVNGWFSRFVFIMGVSISITMKSLSGNELRMRPRSAVGKILKRTLILFFVGLIISNRGQSILSSDLPANLSSIKFQKRGFRVVGNKWVQSF